MITTMTPSDWHLVRKFFKPESSADKWGDPRKMAREIVFELYGLRRYIGHPIIVHCGFDARPGTESEHPKGTAVDCHIEGLNLIDQFIAASRFNFRGIGVYKYWSSPGLHLDMRTNASHRSLWGATGPKQYVELNKNFLKGLL